MSTSLGEQTRQEKVERLRSRNENLRAQLHQIETRAGKAIEARKEAEERAEELGAVALGFQMLAIDLFLNFPRNEYPDGALREFRQLVDDRVALQPDE